MPDISANRVVIEYTSETARMASGNDEVVNSLQKTKKASKESAKGIQNLKSQLRSASANAKNSAGAFSKLATAVGRIAFYRAIRSAIKEVTQAFQEGTTHLYYYSQALNNLDSAKASGTMNEFATTALYVKNSLGAALMPILQSLVPVVNAIADAFVWATNAVNQFFHALKGESVFTKAKRYAVDYAEALGGASGAAKELKKQVFGFDELNIFNAPSAGGGGGGAPEMDYSKMFEEAEVTANFDWLGSTIKQKLAGITTIVSGALLAVGAILTLSGIAPGIGIAMMAAGAVGFMAGSINWDSGSEKVKSALSKVVMVVGGLLLGVGAILALSSINLPLGIALMAIGATSFASAAALNWDSLGNTVKDKLGFILAAVSASFLVLGAILMFIPAHQALGLGLLAAGAAGLASGVDMSDTLKTLVVNKFKEIGAQVSIAVLALGAILAFIPATMPLGLGLMAAGAIGLAASVMMNDELKKQVKDKLDAIKTIVGLSLTALGGVLLFVNPALGIPLLITGLALVGSTIDWDALYNKISEKWEAIKKKLGEIKEDVLGFVNTIKGFFRDLLGLNASPGLTVDKPNTGQNQYGFERRANGGFVDTGTFFLAGEAGPELVGTVGGKTNVTNQDQFTAGMWDVMDNTNTVILQAAQSLINAIQQKDMTPVVSIGDRDIVRAYDRGKTLAGGSLVK